MNELENTLPQEESATPKTTASLEASNSSQAENTEENITVSETQIEETTNLESEQQADTVNYFDMTKKQLLETLQNIVNQKEASRHKDVSVIKQAFYNIRKVEIEAEYQEFEKQAESADAIFTSKVDEEEVRFKDLLNEFKELRAAYLEAEETRRLANLDKKLAIIDRLKALAEDVDNINLNIAEVRQLQEEFKAIVEIPASKVSETWKTYQLVVEQIFDGLKVNKELRDLDFKKNLAIKQDLIRQAHDLQDEKDVIAAFKKLQILHDTWRETGPVAKDLREQIWDEFKELSTAINKRHQEFFEARKKAEHENEEAKAKICEEIEAIDLSTLGTYKAWEDATAAIKDMQERWKSLGFASKGINNALFTRFRKSCDDFFAAKAAYYTKIKEEFAANLEKKTKLCEEAETLKESTDLKSATEKIRELQAKWKTIGSVSRKHSDAIWQRFMSACNYFFDARKKEIHAHKKEENENLEAKKAVIEELRAIPEGTSREDAIKLVADLQAKWQAIGHVPFKLKDSIYEEYRDTLNKVRNQFDFRETRSKMENFKNQIDNMKGDSGKLSKERDRLNRMLDQKRNELTTFENNMGFFSVKSKEGNSMFKEMERRIERIKEEIETLRQKISMIDD